MFLNRLLWNHYKRTIEKALEYGLIKKRSAVRVLNLFKYGTITCEICHSPLSFGKKKKMGNIDHKIPTSKGGTDDFDNLQVTHTKCNRKKSNR